MKRLLAVMFFLGITFSSCQMIVFMNLPKEARYEKITIGMGEEEFKNRHSKSQNCIMSKESSVYYIIYRKGEPYVRFYYFEDQKLNYIDDGQKANKMELDCKIRIKEFE
tara:strand:- start:131 stop:457 length:327 start_codon:yes stop_codon:yes gene_type:complete